jgi:hypothetical protein
MEALWTTDARPTMNPHNEGNPRLSAIQLESIGMVLDEN